MRKFNAFINQKQLEFSVSIDKHFALTQKALNSFRCEPIVDEPIIELQKNCESTEIIIF